MKRKLTTKQRLNDHARRAAELDERRQVQVGQQLTTINRLLLLHKAVETFLHETDQHEAWQAYLGHVTAEPCYICGDHMNHYGVAHSDATGDKRTRADVDAAAAAAEPEPVGSTERDAGPESPTLQAT